jgi:hypothetical protein
MLFYESFHHAFYFDELLTRLHDRLKPGGRVVLCGEPVVSDLTDGIPYPWGPRLDALSVFCMRRFGWSLRRSRSKGWVSTFHPFPNFGRAAIYVLEPTDQKLHAPPLASSDDRLLEQIRSLEGVRASTSWRIISPPRASKHLFDRLRRG